MTFYKTLFSKITKRKHNGLFEDIIGYDDIKKLFIMALDPDAKVHILLVGPPASAKTMFLTSLMYQLKNSYFIDGGNSTKAGLIDYMFANKPRYLLIDEIDKMSCKDQTSLLNLMETGMISETKHDKTRTVSVKTSVFATSNSARQISTPLQSRFLVLELEPYTHEQFCAITKQLLSSNKVPLEVANLIADEVWNRSRDVRDCVRIGQLATTEEDVKFLIQILDRRGEPQLDGKLE